MKIKNLIVLFSFITLAFPALAQENFEMDTIKTDKGDLEITFIGHGTLMFRFEDKVIHIDPWDPISRLYETAESRPDSDYPRAPRSPRSGCY